MFIMRSILLFCCLLWISSCSSSVTKLSRVQSGEITRKLKLPVVDEVIETADSIKESAPLRVRLYHLPRVGYQRLQTEENWDQPPHIYEYDYAEEQYVEKYVLFNVEKQDSMNIIDYINSNIQDPAGFQQNQKKRFLLGF